MPVRPLDQRFSHGRGFAGGEVVQNQMPFGHQQDGLRTFGFNRGGAPFPGEFLKGIFPGSAQLNPVTVRPVFAMTEARAPNNPVKKSYLTDHRPLRYRAGDRGLLEFGFGIWRGESLPALAAARSRTWRIFSMVAGLDTCSSAPDFMDS